MKNKILILCMLAIGAHAQNRAPVAEDDSTTAKSINILINDSDPDGDALRVLDYSIGGVKYSPRNSPRQTALGLVTFTSSGDVSCDTSGVIIYRISDGNRGVDTGVITFYRSSLNIDSSFLISQSFYSTSVIVTKGQPCKDTGKYYALIQSGNTYMYGALQDTSSSVVEKYRFMLSGDVIYKGYPYGDYFVKQHMTWSVHVPREIYLMVIANGCKQ